MMSAYRIVFIQSGAGGGSAAGQPTPNVQVVRVGPQSLGDQIRTEVRQSVQAATQAAAESREMQQAIRDAERHVRDAERQVREARTDDQRGAAGQELFEAKTELQALQSIGHPGPVIVQTGTGQPTHFPQDVIPPQVVDMAMGFFIMLAVIIIGWPLARAFGRRIERRADVPAADPVLAGQLQRIEQAVEAMSIEIERISESQRFMAKLQNGASPERSALGTGERR
jgi:hypothetical protein